MPDDVLTLPPIAVDDETDEQERQRRLQQRQVPTIPAPAIAQQPAQPQSQPQATPSLPPVQVSPQPAGSPTATPPIAPPKPVMEGAQPQPAASLPPINPQRGVNVPGYQNGPPQLHGWKKAADVIASMFPIGRAVETAIPGTPQNFDMEQQKAMLRASKGQEIQKGAQEITKGQQEIDQAPKTADLNRRDIESQITARENKPDAAKTLTPEESTIHDLMAGDKGQPRIDPKTNQPYTYIDAYKAIKEAGEKPAAGPRSTDTEQAIQDLIQSDPKTYPGGDTAANRTAARTALKQKDAQYSSTAQDIKDTAQAIIHGQASPMLTQYSFRDRTAIEAELQRAGFNQRLAQQDYQAVQRRLAALNGPQQLRFKQAIEYSSALIPQIQEEYDRLAALAPRYGYKVLNKVAMAAMEQLPGEAGSAAHQLQANLADFTSDLGTVYKGGNSSTDESLALAAKNLSSDWNDQTFRDAIKRIKESIELRNNSMNLAEAAVGLSQGSAYQIPTEKGTGKNWNPATGKYE